MGLILLNGKPMSATARVALTNCRVADVVKGCYFQAGVNIVIRNGRIEAMPGLPGEPHAEEIRSDFTLDLRGRAVIPGLFNTHSHLQLTLPALLAGPG